LSDLRIKASLEFNVSEGTLHINCGARPTITFLRSLPYC